MSLSLVATKESDTDDACLYAIGTPGNMTGRVRLHKSSGDIEILDRPASADGLNPHFVLAEVVPRLQGYHDRRSYPDRDRWSV